MFLGCFVEFVNGCLITDETIQKELFTALFVDAEVF